MALMIAVNAALSLGVTLMVVAPLSWAILTEHRDLRAVVAQRQRLLSIQITRPAPA